jgi:hypothetical protein
MTQTVAEIDASLAALRAALANGELSVRFADGRQVTYQSADDLTARMAALRNERVSIAAGQTGSFRMRSFPVVMRRE